MTTEKTWDEIHCMGSWNCTSGKPALFYSCNAFGPVCEDHICRCRPSLLTERAEKARRETIERCIRELRSLGVPEIAFTLIFKHLGL